MSKISQINVNGTNYSVGNAGTITGITMNGASKGTSGVIDLGTVITQHQDISGKQDTISDLSTIRSNATKGNTALTNLGGLKLVSLTQAQYNALSTKDSSTVYFIKG